MRVDEPLAVECLGEPVGERAAASVLKRRTAAEDLYVDAARPEDRESFARRMPGEPS